MKFEHLVMSQLGQIMLDNFSLKVIEELKTIPINATYFISTHTNTFSK